MYNVLKIDMTRNDCDCDYVLSEDGKAITPFVYLHLHVGEGLTNPKVKLAANNVAEPWYAPDLLDMPYENGMYYTRLSYRDFQKCGDYELEAAVYDGDTLVCPRILYFFHSGLQSEGNWILTKQHGAILSAFNVAQGSTSGSGGGGGSGGTTYTAGKGIEISDSNEIKANIDCSTIQFNENNQMYVPTVPLSLQNAVIIKEADSKYLLHEYTQIEYIAGNKIGYAGPQNQIIVQGYVFNYTSLAYPAIAPYRGVAFEQSSSNEKGPITENAEFYLEFTNFTTTSAGVQLKCDEYDYTSTLRTTCDTTATGIYLKWSRINAPNDIYPYGYIYGEIMMLFKMSTTSTELSNGGSKYLYVPFASEAEYNAAVGLTYEPVSLTSVTETTTKV